MIGDQRNSALAAGIDIGLYPVWAQLFGLAYETVPLDGGMRVRVEDYMRPIRRFVSALAKAVRSSPTNQQASRAGAIANNDEQGRIKCRKRSISSL